MSIFFRSSTLWVVDYCYEGRARRWWRVYAQGVDPEPELRGELSELYGERARLLSARPANAGEHAAYGWAETEPNVYCPTAR